MSFDLAIASSVNAGITRFRQYNNRPLEQGARQGQRQALKPEHPEGPRQPEWLVSIVGLTVKWGSTRRRPRISVKNRSFNYRSCISGSNCLTVRGTCK